MGGRGAGIFVVVIAVATITAALIGTASTGSGSGGSARLSADQVHAAKKKCKKRKRKCRKRRPAPVIQAAPTPQTSTPQLSVYTVPDSIPSDCSVPVEEELMAWLATVPDGSTAQFAQGGCYGQDGTITLSDRSDLVIDGRGSEFRALTLGGSHRSNWRFIGGGNLTVRDLAVRGSDPQGAYDHAIEWQHGFDVEGVQRMTLSDVQARETWGDGIDLWHGGSSPACGDDASSARDVLISGATLARIGRQGVAVVDAERVTVQDSTIGPVAWANVDLETDDDCEIARHVTLSGNSFGSNGWGVIVNGGLGADPQVGDLTVNGNTQTDPTIDTGILTPDPCRAPVRILSPDSVYRSSYTFTDNHFLATANGLVFRRVNDVNVSGNTIAFTPTSGCDTRNGVRLVDSHLVTITGNVFSGAGSAYSADPASTEITASGNTLD